MWSRFSWQKHCRQGFVLPRICGTKRDLSIYLVSPGIMVQILMLCSLELEFRCKFSLGCLQLSCGFIRIDWLTSIFRNLFLFICFRYIQPIFYGIWTGKWVVFFYWGEAGISLGISSTILELFNACTSCVMAACRNWMQRCFWIWYGVLLLLGDIRLEIATVKVSNLHTNGKGLFSFSRYLSVKEQPFQCCHHLWDGRHSGGDDSLDDCFQLGMLSKLMWTF